MFAQLSDDRRQDLITVLSCITEYANFSAMTLDSVKCFVENIVSTGVSTLPP